MQMEIEMKVIYEGTIPNNFETAKSVVVTGQYQNGYFHAKDILTKCPSKYEEQNSSSLHLCNNYKSRYKHFNTMRIIMIGSIVFTVRTCVQSYLQW